MLEKLNSIIWLTCTVSKGHWRCLFWFLFSRPY